MKRDELKELGLTDEQIDAVMRVHGQEIQAEQAKTAEALQRTTDAENKLKAFDGVDIDALNKEIDELKAEKASYLFNGKIKDAIQTAGGRSVKAISALLDIDALKALTEGQDEAIAKAVADAKEQNSWAFTTAETKPEATPVTVKTGDEHGEGGTGDEISNVEKLFLAQNPGLKV